MVADGAIVVAVLFLAWLGIHYAEERQYNDASVFLLRMVDSGWFYVNNGRWIMPLSQWMVILGIHWGASMHTLMVLYALGNTAVLVGALVFVRGVLRDRPAAIALVATQLLGLAHAHFCPVFEFYYGSMLLIVLLALFRASPQPGIAPLALFAVLLFLALSSHPMAMIVTAFSLLLFRVDRSRRFAAVALITMLAQLLIRWLVLSDYEANAMDAVGIRLDRWGMTWMFVPGRLYGQLWRAVAHYPDLLLLGLAVIWAAWCVQERALAIAYGAGTLVIYMLTSLYYPDGSHGVYREIVDYPFIVWTIVALYRSRWDALSGKVVGTLLVLSLVLRMVLVPITATTYVTRVQWMKDRISSAHRQGIQRGLVIDPPPFVPPGIDAVPIDALNPVEVLLFSSALGPDSTVVLFPVHPANARDSIAVVIDQRWRHERIPLIWNSGSPYFNLPPSPYRSLKE
jgi:hypothetical protein